MGRARNAARDILQKCVQTLTIEDELILKETKDYYTRY